MFVHFLLYMLVNTASNCEVFFFCLVNVFSLLLETRASVQLVVLEAACGTFQSTIKKKKEHTVFSFLLYRRFFFISLKKLKLTAVFCHTFLSFVIER